jgi:CheY-like chemotaxis protein
MSTESVVEILVVEDNPDDLELTLSTFREHDLAKRVEVARDGAEALEFLFCTGTFAGRNLRDGPRLVLLDIKLPKVDGLEVLRQVKADPRTRAIPVVVLTSSHEDRDLTESYQLGVNSYLVKPVGFEEFSEVVQRLGHYWLLLNKTALLL